MIDKVQKIREKVVKIINSINPFIPDEDGKNSDYEAGRLAMATQILQYIDSLQAEPSIPEIVDEHYWEMLGEEPVSNPIDFEKELYKAFGQVKDFTLGMQIAKWFYDMGKKSREPVSEDLEEAAVEWFNSVKYKSDLSGTPINAFKAVAKWQIAKLMKDATEVTVHIEAGNYPYIPQIELYDYDKDMPLAKECDKYKVILIKEE